MDLAENTRSEGIFGLLHLAIVPATQSVAGPTITAVFLILIIRVKVCQVKALADTGLGRPQHMTRLGGIDGEVANYYLRIR
jgi:hypothetical protein